MSIINEEIEAESQELFAQVSSETTLDEYIDFDAETITSQPAADPTHVDWRQECGEKSIAQVLLSEDTVLINHSGDKIAHDEKMLER